MKKKGSPNIERLQTIYDFIVTYKNENNGCAPSYREVGAVVGVESPSLSFYYLKQLSDMELITLNSGSRRDICVVNSNWTAPAPVNIREHLETL